jgi:hypothetical protein
MAISGRTEGRIQTDEPVLVDPDAPTVGWELSGWPLISLPGGRRSSSHVEGVMDEDDTVKHQAGTEDPGMGSSDRRRRQELPAVG